MSSRALDIVDEFRRSSDPQLQKNAATALAAIGTTESIGRLVDLVLEGRDSGLRRRVLDELVRLDTAGKEEAVQMLRRELAEAESRELAEARQRARRADAPEAEQAAGRRSDPEQDDATRRERGERAYWVLGQLRARGRAVGTFPGGWRQRVARALRLQDRIRRAEGSGGLEAAVRGSVTGLLLLVWPYAAIGYAPELGRVLPLLLAALLGGIVLVIMGVRRLAPIDFYPDPAAGVVAELAGTVRASWLAAVILALLAVLAPTVFADGNAGMGLPAAAVAWVLSTLIIMLLGMMVRLGAIVSRTLLPGPRFQAAGQAAGGAAAGLVFVTVATLAVSVLAHALPGWEAVGDRMDLLWLLLLPFCVAGALASVRTDRRAPRELPAVPRRIGVPVFAFLILSVALLVGSSARAKPLWPEVAFPHDTVPVALLPAEFAFSVPEPYLLVARAGQDSASEDIVLALRKGTEVIETADDPEELEVELTRGMYALRVYEFGSAAVEAAAPLNQTVATDLLRRLFARPLIQPSPRSFAPLPRADSTARPFNVVLRRLPAGGAQHRKLARAHADSAMRLVTDSSSLNEAVRFLALADSGRGRDAVAPYVYHQVCWHGILGGLVEKVARFCEVGVRRDSSDLYALSYRGLARALSGDKGGAIEDFTRLAGDTAVAPAVRQRRREFIARLHQGGTITLEDAATVSLEESGRLTAQEARQMDFLAAPVMAPTDTMMVPVDTITPAPGRQ